MALALLDAEHLSEGASSLASAKRELASVKAMVKSGDCVGAALTLYGGVVDLGITEAHAKSAGGQGSALLKKAQTEGTKAKNLAESFGRGFCVSSQEVAGLDFDLRSDKYWTGVVVGVLTLGAAYLLFLRGRL
jgi:hypothetical protein